MDYISIIIKDGIPKYVEATNDRGYAEKLIYEVAREMEEVRGKREWSPKRRIKAYIWSTISGQIVWAM